METLVLSFLLPVICWSQAYTVVSAVIASGVGKTTVGPYTLTGTLGQPFVGGSRLGGGINTAGFWNQVAKVSGPVFAADTGFIVYSRSGDPDGTIWMRAIDGSYDTMVCVGAWPRLSHDGRYIAHHKGSNSGPWFQDFYVYDLLTHQDSLIVTNNSRWIMGYSWSADDSTIVFDFDCGIDMINRDGSGRINLFTVNCYDDAPTIQPGGSTIAFHDASYGILLTDMPSSNRRVVPGTMPGDFWAAWSPDGQWISFRRIVNADDWNYYKVHPDGSGLTLLKNFASPGIDADRGGVWTPDGSKLLVVENIDSIQGIYAIATDGSGAMGLVMSMQGDSIEFVGSVTGNIDLVLTDVEDPAGPVSVVPRDYDLGQNYPNPFNPSTTISYSLPFESRVRLRIYNIFGQEVDRLVDGVEGTGYKSVTWDPRQVASGVYMYVLDATSVSNPEERFSRLMKMLLVK